MEIILMGTHGSDDIGDIATAGSHVIFNPATLEATGFMKTIIKDQLITLFEMLYLTRLKPTLTSDRYMPWPLRQLVHEVSNEVWTNVMLELPRNLDSLMPANEQPSRYAAVRERYKRVEATILARASSLQNRFEEP